MTKWPKTAKSAKISKNTKKVKIKKKLVIFLERNETLHHCSVVPS
jgi:hypothetical protein